MRMPAQRRGYLAVGGSLMATTLFLVGTGSYGAVGAGHCADKDAAPVGCSEPGAVYQVLATVPSDRGGCPQGDYVEHRGASGRTLCLGYNVAAGDCVQDDPSGPALVACRSVVATPTFRVLRVVENRATSKACRSVPGDAVVALRYSKPAKTLCIVHLPLDPTA